MADVKIIVDTSDVVKAKNDTKALKKTYTDLDKAMKPLIQKEEAFAKAVRSVNNAQRLGLRTNKQAIADIQALGKAYGYTETQINRVTASMSGVRKNTNRMNATIQNAGYQFGDFFVQIQSGQNALVAFSQQGAQLAGLMPGLAGAVAGVGLVLGSMLARALMDGTNFMKGFGQAVEEVAEKLTKFEESFKKVAEGFRDELGPEVEKFAKVILQKDLMDATKAMEDSMGSFGGYFSKLGGQIRATAKEVDVLKAAYKSAESAAAALELEKLEGIRDTIQGIGDIDPTNADELRSAIDAIATIIEQDLAGGIELGKGEMKSLVTLGESLQSVLDTITPEQEAQTDELAAQKAHLEAILRLEQARDNLAGSLEQKFAASTRKLELMRGGMGAGLAGSQVSMEQQIAELVAAERAVIEATQKQRGSTSPQDEDYLASFERNLRVELDAHMQRLAAIKELSRVKTETSKVELEQLDAQVQAYLKVQETIHKVLDAKELELRQSKSLIGLSKEEAELQKFIYDLEKKMGVTRSQLNEEQTAQFERILDLRRQEIALMEEKKAAAERVEAAEKKVQAVSSAMATETVGALKSIVNGTKTASEAFRDMALNIIQQIMDILIWQPLIQSLTNAISGGINSMASGGGGFGNLIGAAFGFANGGAFSNGNVIPFAKGGVVGSPTYFGMSGGRTGLMGEAGPEAIMPLKRGPDGKLGVQGGGGVTVNQHFNFSANGDESVKKIIAEAAPKIAQMTEAKIINSRQRGGQMRRAFG